VFQKINRMINIKFNVFVKHPNFKKEPGDLILNISNLNFNDFGKHI